MTEKALRTDSPRAAMARARARQASLRLSRTSLLRTFLLLFGTLVALAFSSLFGQENFPARLLLAISFSIYLALLIEAILARGEKIFTLVTSLFFIMIMILPALIQCARGVFPFFSKSYPD